MNITRIPVTNLRAGRPFGITGICIHHNAGQLTARRMAEVVQSRGVSYNYGIGSDGVVAELVAPGNRAFHAGDGVGVNSRGNDRSIGIGVSNSGGAPNWPVSPANFERLVELCTVVARQQGWRQLTLGANGNLFMHRDVRATACPGPFLQGRMTELRDRVNRNLAATNTPAPPAAPATPAPAAPRPPAPAPQPISGFFPRATGAGIVAALGRVERDTSFAHRARIAAANNIRNYTGTAAQNTTMLGLLQRGQLRRANNPASPANPAPSNRYFPRGTGTGIVAALNSIGINSSFDNRARIARANNIANYRGTASQNIDMLGRLRAGRLIRP